MYRWKYAIALGLGLAVFGFALGVPLLGWGIADWRGFLSIPVRAVYSVTVLLQAALLFVGYLLLPFTYLPSQQRGQAGKQVVRQAVVPIVARLVWLVALVIAGWGDRRDWLQLPDPSWVRYLGLLIYILALGWIYWSFWTLGRQHSAEVTIQEHHVLVTRGPYRWVRHPMYLGLLLFPMGAALVFGSLLAVGLQLVLVLLFVWRIGDEERLMAEEFGDRWVAYSSRTWRLIPRVY